MPRHRPILRAFTLVELLVVVSIIGLLVGILVPSLSHARTRARKVACGAVLHGLSVGMKSYLSQYSEHYPAAAEMPSVNTSLPALSAALKDEVSASAGTGAAHAWRCPADNLGYTRASDHRSFGSYFEGETLSYEYNIVLGGKTLESYFLYPLLGSSGVLILADFDSFHGPTGQPASKNILFADGHVGGIDDIRITGTTLPAP
jgi:prepilin-type N-terminal cleavage/methylation domain-containing protein/prepilin-type processing-associated H-X9-DG protein